MLQALNRYKWFLLLAVLVIFNVVHYWPARRPAVARNPGGGPPMAFPTPDAAMQSQIDALPDDQRLAVQNWIKDSKDFFTSVQNLSQADRWQKMQEHFAQNPPPPGMPFPGPPPGGGGPGPGGSPPPGGPPGGPGGPGSPGGGGWGGVPPPEVRHGMDQGLVNRMKAQGIP
jgi:hypothetical protein